MVVEGEILAVVSALYEAALGQQAWPDVLAQVALLLGDSGAMLRWDPPPSRPGDVPASLSAGLTILRPDGREADDSREAALLGILGPHLRRALRVERRHAAVPADRRPGRSAGGSPLSRRERDCLARISRGASSKTVARQLDLSFHTVDQHIRSAMAKLGASTRTGAVIMALERGLLPPPELALRA
jgi:DNA-binding CsgD family transcriptional regulator